MENFMFRENSQGLKTHDISLRVRNNSRQHYMDFTHAFSISLFLKFAKNVKYNKNFYATRIIRNDKVIWRIHTSSFF